LSKYIHVTSCFEVFIETNLMIQLEFNLVLWFASYNIFLVEAVEPTTRCSCMRVRRWCLKFSVPPLLPQE
jgi:hypothetical protein